MISMFAFERRQVAGIVFPVICDLSPVTLVLATRSASKKLASSDSASAFPRSFNKMRRMSGIRPHFQILFTK